MSTGPFAVPVPAYRLGIHTARKRKRASTSASSAGAEPPAIAERATSQRSRTSSPAAVLSLSRLPLLPSDSINPLSHSPETLRQFAVAGLSPEDENPATLYPGFPHKALPAGAVYYQSAAATIGSVDSKSFYDGSDADDLDDNDDDARHAGASAAAGVAPPRRGRGSGASGRTPVLPQKHSARLRHISVMTALVHRCLAEGDIPRARRAFGLLVQTRDVDIKLGNFWLVGAEILMRKGEVGKKALPSDEGQSEYIEPGKSKWLEDDDADRQRERDVVDTRRQPPTRQQQQEDKAAAMAPTAPIRWGRAENADKVKAYFENLVAHFPHDKHRPHLVSAVDFYPALYSFEVYNISAEFSAALERLEAEFLDDDDDDDDDNNDEADDDDGGNGDTSLSDIEGSSVLHHRDEYQDTPLRRYGHHPNYEDQEDNFSSGQHHYRHHHQTSASSPFFSSRHHTPRDSPRREATDEIRRQTQILAQQVATAMDRTMEDPPFASHPELLRLRASLAVFVADLYLPSRVVERVLHALGIERPGLRARRMLLRDRSRAGGDRFAADDNADGSGIDDSNDDYDRRAAAAAGRESRQQQSQRREKASKIMDNLAKYLREPEERVAVLEMRPQEQRRARNLFRKVMDQGVPMEDWVENFVDLVNIREDDGEDIEY
ncbi:RNA polymerase I-specific transcription initiation factor RRN11 [Microdochium nivale]|nr:RNA polymerase I-specific transcription initiation factor RRN11 [Microdochium nivale]